MKKILSRFLIALELAAPAVTINSCVEEDAPTYAYSTADMEGPWRWETETGDLTGYFQVSISKVSETKIRVDKFHNNASMEMELTEMNSVGANVSFEGKLGNSFVVKNGKGRISNGYQSMELSYEVYEADDEDFENPDKIEIKLTKGQAISKKATAQLNYE